MTLNEQIQKKFDEIELLLDRKKILFNTLNNLHIGDEVYIDGSYGDMFPQKIIR